MSSGPDAAQDATAALLDQYVQLERLHASLNLSDVLLALQETLINLLGSEDFAVFVRNPQTGAFDKLLSEGRAAAALPSFLAPESEFAAVLGQRQVTYDAGYVAVVPLPARLDGGAIGLIVVTGLLAHKAGLTPHDKVLLTAYVDHAGLALEAALCAAALYPAAVSASDHAPAAAHDDPASRHVDVLVFACADQLFALPLRIVRRVARMVGLAAALPGAPANCLGLIDYQGSLVPLLDMAAHLGLAAPRNVDTLINGHIILLHVGADTIGYAVDGLHELSDHATEAMAAQVASNGVLGNALSHEVIRLDSGQVVPLLAHNSLLNTVTRHRLTQAMVASSVGAISR